MSGHIVLRPQRAINIGRVFLALTYLAISLSFPDTSLDAAEQIERATLVVYLIFALVGLAVASRSWFAEASMRLPMLLIDSIAFIALISQTGGGGSPYKAAFILLLIVAVFNVPKVPKLIVPAIAVLVYLIAIKFGLNVTTKLENRFEGIALNALHMLWVGTCIAVFLEGGWRRKIKGDARKNLEAADISESGYSLLELSVAGAKNALGASSAHLFVKDREEFRAYLVKDGARPVRLDAPQSAIATIMTLPAHTSLIKDHGRYGYRLSQPPSRAYGPQLGRISPDIISVFRQFSSGEGVLLPVQILDDFAYLLLEYDQPLTEAHMLRAAQSRHRITKMVENYERRLSVLAIAKERERQTILRNLHDGTIQSLSAIHFHLRRLVTDPKTDSEIRETLDTVETIVSSEARRLRDLSSKYDAPVDCAALLMRTARDLERKWQIDCSFAQSANVRAMLDTMPEEGASVAQDFAYAMEEMVANGVRHGKSSKISFKLSATADVLKLNFHGNGTPPKPSQALPKSLSKRVADMAGQLSILPEKNGYSMQIVIKNRSCAYG